MKQRLRNLILTTTLQHGHMDRRLDLWVEDHLIVCDRHQKIGIMITKLPLLQQARTAMPEFLVGFTQYHRDALLYILEDSQPIQPGQSIPECTYEHLNQLANFLKETN